MFKNLKPIDGEQNHPLEIPEVAPEVVLPIPAAPVLRRRGRPPAGERANPGQDRPIQEEPGRRRRGRPPAGERDNPGQDRPIQEEAGRHRRGRPPVRGQQAVVAQPVIQADPLVQADPILPVEPLILGDPIVPADENGHREIEPMNEVQPLGPVRRQRGRRAAVQVEEVQPLVPLFPLGPDRQIEARRNLRPRALPRAPYDPADFVPVGLNRRRPAAGRLPARQAEQQPDRGELMAQAEIIQPNMPHPMQENEQPIRNEEEQQLRNPCNICYLREVNRLVAPCGHTFCDVCLTNLTNVPRCFVCRANIATVFPMFI